MNSGVERDDGPASRGPARPSRDRPNVLGHPADDYAFRVVEYPDRPDE